MKNPNKIAACLLAALLLCAPAGCRLAQEEESEQAGKDRLAGALVTTEYLDLFDYDSFLRDNIGSIVNGETIENTRQYQGRLYATLRKKTLTNEETGETLDTDEYVFEGVKGVSYFSLRDPGTAGHEGHHVIIGDEGVSDAHTSVSETDDGSALSLEATINVSPMGMQHEYFVNPVYQSADGRVYAVSGVGGFFAVGMEAEGVIYSQTLNETYTVTENGKAKSDKVSVKISLNIMHPPKKIVVLQMDANGTAVSRAEYAPGTLPKGIAPENGAEYIIVETYKTDGEGKEQVSRELYGKDAESIATFYCQEDGICVKQWTELRWGK